MKLVFIGPEDLAKELSNLEGFKAEILIFSNVESFMSSEDSNGEHTLMLAFEEDLFHPSVEDSAKWILVDVSSASSLQQALEVGMDPEKIGGFMAFSGFLGKSKFEFSSANPDSQDPLNANLLELGFNPVACQDRPGLISARVLAMIINEAYYTVMEGTAEKKDVDMAMKLGTNYPKGPFEWSKEIGLDRVYQLLEALWEDTKDERYKICPLLKKEVQLEA